MKNVKLGARYGLMGLIMYLAYTVTSVKYVHEFELGYVPVLQVIVGAVFAALTLVVKFHFETKVDSDAK